MNSPGGRKDKLRRSSENVKKLSIFPEENPEEVIVAAPSDAYEYLSRIINPEKCLKSSLFHSSIKLIKVVSKSAWVELFLIKKHKLKNCASTTKTKYLELNPLDNILSHSINAKKEIVITNPHTSTEYQRFPTHLEAYSTVTGLPIKIYATACVPLNDNSNTVFAVAQLFNKVENNNFQGFYNKEDIKAVVSVGKLLGEVFNTRKIHENTKKYNSFLFKLVEEDKRIWKEHNFISKKEQKLRKLIEILKSTPEITEKLLKLIKKVMDCDSFTIFSANSGTAELLLSCGVEENYERILKLVEYCSAKKNSVLNIRNLRAEPFVDSKYYSDLNSCLLVPVTLKTKLKFVMCFLRKNAEFSSGDQYFAEQISEAISLYEDFAKNGYGNKTSEGFKNIKNLKNFSLLGHANFDYQLFFSIKASLKPWFNLSSCTFYIADQVKNQLWTRNSISSKDLFYPCSSEFLIGRTYQSNKEIILPNNRHDDLSDIETFKDKHAVSLPVRSSNFKHPVLGVLVCTRNNARFTEIEMSIFKLYLENIANMLECLYFNSFPDFEGTIEHDANFKFTSPDTQFREVNKKKYDIRSFSLGSEKKPELLDTLSLFANMPIEKIVLLQSLIPKLNDTNNELDFYKDLHKFAECEKSEFYILKSYVKNIITNEKINVSPYIKACLQKKCTIFVENGKLKYPENDDELIYLETCEADYIYQAIHKSFMLVPVLNNLRNTIGILHLVNFHNSLSQNDIKSIESLSLFLKIMYFDKESEKWQEIIEETISQSSLQEWSRKLIQTANKSIMKMLLCQSAIFNIFNCKDIEKVMRYCLEILCAIMDCDNAEVVIKIDNSICKITKQNYKFIESFNSFTEDLSFVLGENTDEENTKTFNLKIPVAYKDLVGYLKLESYDSTDKNFEDFRIKNEETLLELGKKIGEALYEFPKTQENSLKELSEFIKLIAFQYKPIMINRIINCASKSLIDGEKALYYTFKDNELVIPDQGDEYIIPQHFSVAKGKSIAYSVFKNEKSEVIKDAYSDERFNTSIDKLTGFKSLDIVYIPLVNNFNKFGVIGVHNKRSGTFNEKDKALLESFGEVVCMVLEILKNMQNTLEEQYRLLSISNTLETYILVFNENQKLIYVNKPIDDIFGPQDQLMNLTYFAFLHGNKNLMEDMQLVFNNSSVQIRKNSQKLKISKPKNQTSGPKQDTLYINYCISNLKNFSAECVSGVILIIENATKTLESLHAQFESFQKEIRSIASPIDTESKLKKCIRELGSIISQVKDIHLKENLSKIVGSLKGGGLKKTKLRINDEEFSMGAIRSMLDMPSTEYIKKISSIDMSSSSIRRVDSEISLKVLRDWDLNSFSVENHYDYIFSMLEDFDVLQKFQVEQSTFFNFISRIKEKCNYWKNPFHNFNHCFNVMHGAYMLLSCTPVGMYLNELEIFSLLIAAVCHDVDHRGRGNMFEVHSRSNIATTYNDKSVLEQHHAAVTFFTMQEEGCNIFSSISREKFNRARKFIITSILGTDMAKHLGLIENMSERFRDITEKPMGTLDKDKEKLAQITMHAADLSHPCKPVNAYELWSMLVCQEFIDQHKQEVELGLPQTEFMKGLHLPHVYYANEIGFLSYVVKPLWDCLNIFLTPQVSHPLENLGKNIDNLKLKLEEWKKAQR